MSRGHGRNQRRAVELLAADERAREEGLPPAALRRALGLDRSNARRLVRSLIARGDLEWATDAETGAPHVKLTFWTCLRVVMQRERYRDEPEPVKRYP
ncbi:MAG: hypothetical protein CYG60_05290 [Actinobacteria bacterium]|nr:MAG: hypothetical protein CYG60_05290 [Actinomycetota bacterium]